MKQEKNIWEQSRVELFQKLDCRETGLSQEDAADRLAVELVNAAESVLTFPYAAPAYQPIRSLKHEYRKILVQNYLMFYWVDEEKKLVTVARVVYAKRDYGRLLE